jgi:hypothetical protein
MRAALAALLFLVPLLAPAANALPTPGVFCDKSDPALGRFFPEAKEANDFISYDEARACIDLLVKTYPDWVKLDLVGKSAGWDKLGGGHDTFDTFVVRVSDYKSNVTLDHKTRLGFQLSIHGNEKGGREGGLRVIEDFARNLGLAAEHKELRERLSWMELLFVFPNPDGWTHEEANYRTNDACYFSVGCDLGGPVPVPVETQSFVRVNGHGVDVNRQWPTVGWASQSHNAMHETEATSMVAYLKNVTNIKYASDIHGMLNPADGTGASVCEPGIPPSPSDFDPTCFESATKESRGHFILTMIPAGRLDPEEMIVNTALAELVKQRLNGDAYFSAWQSAPTSAQGAWGGEFDSWGTVWDTLGYTDSGFTSDWYAQDTGLNVPGVDFEMAYNHVTVDDYYPGAGMFFNDYHVQAVRDIVRAFMDQAALDVRAHIESHAQKVAYLRNSIDITNEGHLGVPEWQANNTLDDAWDTAHKVYHAKVDDYFVDLKAKLQDNGAPGVLDAVSAADIDAGKLAGYDALVITNGTMLSPASVAPLKAWVEKGGHLVLTDSALALLVPLGAAKPDGVAQDLAYAGHTNFVDTKHPLAQGIRGLGRETYEPVPLGYSIRGLHAPVWYVKQEAFSGDVVGLQGDGQGGTPNPGKVNFGQAKVGTGTIAFLGALLPTPGDDPDTPYGIDSYATTYTGNQLLHNALGYTETSTAEPAVPGVVAKPPPTPAQTPGQPLAILLLALVAVGLARRRG